MSTRNITLYKSDDETDAFKKTLSEVVKTLRLMGNVMGDLSQSQAALFHNATRLLQDLEEILEADAL